MVFFVGARSSVLEKQLYALSLPFIGGEGFSGDCFQLTKSGLSHS